MVLYIRKNLDMMWGGPSRLWCTDVWMCMDVWELLRVFSYISIPKKWTFGVFFYIKIDTSMDIWTLESSLVYGCLKARDVTLLWRHTFVTSWRHQANGFVYWFGVWTLVFRCSGVWELLISGFFLYKYTKKVDIWSFLNGLVYKNRHVYGHLNPWK